MTRLHRPLLTAALAGSLLLAAATPAMAGDTGAALRGPEGDWRTSTQGVRQTITFDDQGKVYGDSGCNRFTGGYKVKGDRITIGPLASTMMYCEGRMEAEQEFLTAIQAAVSFKANKRTLTIFTPDGKVPFRAARA